MANKALMCKNCNGLGPFLELVAIQLIDKNGQPHRTEQMGTKFYMCVSKGDNDAGEPEGCKMVSTLEELAR